MNTNTGSSTTEHAGEMDMKLPWIVWPTQCDVLKIRDSSNSTVAVIRAGDEGLTDEQFAAARLLVLAVNHHAKLVEALQECEELLDAILYGKTRLVGPTLTNVRDALSLLPDAAELSKGGV